MPQDYATLVERLIREIEEEHDWSGKTAWVTPKRGILIRRSRWAPDWLQEGEIVFQGKFYPFLAWIFLKLRTVFRKHSFLIDGVPYYLELKGYGENGRTLYLSEHVSGDVYYGMYLENAIKEFERLEKAALAGLSVTLPLGVVEIPREEYLRVALEGFQFALDAHFILGDDVFAQFEDIIGKQSSDFEDFCKEAAARIVSWVKRHPEGVEAGIRTVMERAYNPEIPQDSFFNGLSRSADALLSGKKFGYIIRASRCPIRVGDPGDKNLDSPENREIAQSAGRAFRGLLELGLLHHCPGTGNWTIAGELTDLQDTFDLRQEWDALAEHVCLVGKKGMEDFVRYLLGPEHGGVLWPFFVEGVCGRKTSLKQATHEVLALLSQGGE